MSSITSKYDAPSNEREALAWQIVLAAFFIFVVIFGIGIYGVQWFVWQSTVTTTMQLSVSRGTVGFERPRSEDVLAVTNRISLPEGATVVTDSTSQAVITFVNHSTGEPIAAVTLMPDTQLTIAQATSPRFAVNTTEHVMRLTQNTGTVEINLLADSTNIRLESTNAQIAFAEVGQYHISTTGSATSVATLRGSANLLADSVYRIRSNQEVSVQPNGTIRSPEAASYSLLRNNMFHSNLSPFWTPYQDTSAPPEGLITQAVFDGKPVVTLDRSQERAETNPLNDPGLTGICYQGSGCATERTDPLTLDVTAFSGLYLRTTFYVEEQSLSTCGELGTECPLMVTIKYIDRGGTEWEYVQGFFAYHNPGLDLPQLCLTCALPTQHERINLQTWYTFESDDLTAFLQDPAVITDLRVYASGWAYRVHVSEIDLVATE